MYVTGFSIENRYFRNERLTPMEYANRRQLYRGKQLIDLDHVYQLPLIVLVNLAVIFLIIINFRLWATTKSHVVVDSNQLGVPKKLA